MRRLNIGHPGVPDLLPVSLVEMLTELERDLLARRRIYHNRTYTGRLSLDRAERRLRILQALIDNLRGQMAPTELAAMEAARARKKEQRELRAMRRINLEASRRK
jgi:hypothetical protein